MEAELPETLFLNIILGRHTLLSLHMLILQQISRSVQIQVRSTHSDLSCFTTDNPQIIPREFTLPPSSNLHVSRSNLLAQYESLMHASCFLCSITSHRFGFMSYLFSDLKLMGHLLCYVYFFDFQDPAKFLNLKSFFGDYL